MTINIIVIRCKKKKIWGTFYAMSSSWKGDYFI
jgi:hypothetical protein